MNSFKELKEGMKNALMRTVKTELGQILKTIQDLEVEFYKEIEALKKV